MLRRSCALLSNALVSEEPSAAFLDRDLQSISQILPLQFCPLDLLCCELMLYRFFMVFPSQVLSWCPE